MRFLFSAINISKASELVGGKEDSLLSRVTSTAGNVITGTMNGAYDLVIKAKPSNRVLIPVLLLSGAMIVNGAMTCPQEIPLGDFLWDSNYRILEYKQQAAEYFSKIIHHDRYNSYSGTGFLPSEIIQAACQITTNLNPSVLFEPCKWVGLASKLVDIMQLQSVSVDVINGSVYMFCNYALNGSLRGNTFNLTCVPL